MTSVPALPKETAYLYARFNKIKKISAKDFAEIGESVLSQPIDWAGNDGEAWRILDVFYFIIRGSSNITSHSIYHFSAKVTDEGTVS